MNEYELMKLFEYFMKDIGLPSNSREYLMNIFLSRTSEDINIGNYEFMFDENLVLIRNMESLSCICINRKLGIIINQNDADIKYYMEYRNKDNYTMQIRKNHGLEEMELYRRYPNTAIYSLSEGVYTYSEIKIDSGSDSDRQTLLDNLDNSEIVNGLRTTFYDYLDTIYPSLCSNSIISTTRPRNDIKTYYYKKQENTDL